MKSREVLGASCGTCAACARCQHGGTLRELRLRRLAVLDALVLPAPAIDPSPFPSPRHPRVLVFAVAVHESGRDLVLVFVRHDYALNFILIHGTTCIAVSPQSSEHIIRQEVAERGATRLRNARQSLRPLGCSSAPPSCSCTMTRLGHQTSLQAQDPRLRTRLGRLQ